MELSIKKLFKPAPQSTDVVVDENKQESETIVQWGSRICAKTQGSKYVLAPFLQKVYLYSINEQKKNEDLGRAQRATILAEIDSLNSKINGANIQIDHLSDKIATNNDTIEGLKEQKTELKQKTDNVNKEDRMKMIIGLIILVPLTLYLFLFYSSTFYSAFLASSEDISGEVTAAMFNPNAIVNSFGKSIFSGCFMLFFPLIFLGLGFALHFFSRQKEKTKYLKMVAVVLVTFCFDCILAYKIGETIHDNMVVMGLLPIDDVYNISKAVADPNTWAVIFCGFIAYIIWGIVFDMTMSGYTNMTSNKTQIEALDSKIATLQNSIATDKNTIVDLKQQINDFDGNIKKLTNSLASDTIIDKGLVKKDMNDFFTGWMQMMAMLTKPYEQQNEAKDEYNRAIEGLNL